MTESMNSGTLKNVIKEVTNPEVDAYENVKQRAKYLFSQGMKSGKVEDVLKQMELISFKEDTKQKVKDTLTESMSSGKIEDILKTASAKEDLVEALSHVASAGQSALAA